MELQNMFIDTHAHYDDSAQNDLEHRASKECEIKRGEIHRILIPVKKIAFYRMARGTTVALGASRHAGGLHIMRERPIHMVRTFKSRAAAKLDLSFGILPHEGFFNERNVGRPLCTAIDADAIGAHRAHLRALAVLCDTGVAHRARKLLEMNERKPCMLRLRPGTILLHMARCATCRFHAVIQAVAVAIDATHSALKMHIYRHPP